MKDFKIPSPVSEISNAFETTRFYIKRDDLIHSEVSGNKLRKLRLHLEKAYHLKAKTLLTVGGAYSNHILATAVAASKMGFNAVGIIRGEEANTNNTTLSLAIKYGMEIIPISREEYKARYEEAFRKTWCQKYNSSYWIPEGGGGFLGVQGCMDIIQELNDESEMVVCSAGTGTTAAGIAMALKNHQQLWVFPALKGDFMKEEIRTLVKNTCFDKDLTNEVMNRISVFNGYARRGFGKVDDQLKTFVTKFYSDYKIPLDLIYTGKAMMGLIDVLKKSEALPESLTFIHTGGVQGNKGFDFRLTS